MCFLTIPVMAQTTAKIKSFKQTTDHIPGNDRRNDLNGNPCALVKVHVVDDIERVEGNKIGDIVKRGVEKRVYMCKGSRNMRVHLANHLPVKVMFQDYQISGLESNRVYELVIEIPDNPVPEESASNNVMQKLIINYSPNNAMVLVDSKICKGKGRIELNLPVGDHSYMIAAEGYITAEGIVKLTDRAPRTITESLVVDNSSISEGNDNANFTMSDILPSRVPQNTNVYQQEQASIDSSVREEQIEELDETVYPSAPIITPPNALNKSFKYEYEGVTFKCKAKKGYVTITGFDFYAENVVIPGKVEYEGDFYPVKEIDTFINGNNYGARKLVIQEGVMYVANYAFVEFRKLVDVTIPNSIREIGKNAFRDNKGLRFSLPDEINGDELRKGRHIKR